MARTGICAVGDEDGGGEGGGCRADRVGEGAGDEGCWAMGSCPAAWLVPCSLLQAGEGVVVVAEVGPRGGSPG